MNPIYRCELCGAEIELTGEGKSIAVTPSIEQEWGKYLSAHRCINGRTGLVKLVGYNTTITLYDKTTDK